MPRLSPDVNWFSNFTFDSRYHLTGITDSILEYAKKSGKRELNIIDVGCSTAIALKEMQKELESNGIKSHTTGVDVSKKVKGQAVCNVNEFLNCDVSEVRGKDGIADVVICSKMALYVFVERRVKIISKSVSFLKQDGILITDINCYEVPRPFDDLRYFYRYFRPPPFAILKSNGMWSFLKEYQKKINLRFRDRTVVLNDKQEAEDYANKIMDGWNRLRWDQKMQTKVGIIAKMLIEKIAPNKPKKQRKKRRRTKRGCCHT